MSLVNYTELSKSLLLTAVFAVWFRWLWTRRHFYKFSMSFPGYIGFPIIGSLHRLKHMKYLLSALGEMMDDCKKNTFCFWIGLTPIFYTADPEISECILKSPDYWEKSKTIYQPICNALGGGILASPASEWVLNRKIINPVFQHNVLLKFVPVFHKCTRFAMTQFDRMANKGEQSIMPMIHTLFMRISVETTMGKDLSTEEEIPEDLATKFAYLIRAVTTEISLAFLRLDVFFKLHLKFHRTKQQMMIIVRELIDLHISKLQKGVESDGDTGESMKKIPNIFIDQALKMHEKKRLSWKDLIGESNTIMATSVETTASSVGATLILLAMHPEVQERLFDEIVAMFPDKDFEMRYEDMEQLPYLDMVIKETLRLVPPVPILGRHVVADAKLNDYIMLPKDIEIIISIFHIHRRKDIWGPDANQFDPDNFLPGKLADMHPYAYIPFSKGGRNCVGYLYGLFAMKVILSGFIRNFRFATKFKYEDLRFHVNIVMELAKEPHLEIFRRPY